MDWILSIMMIAFYFLAGNKWKWVWIYSAICNAVWIYYAVTIDQYGLIPSSAMILIVAIRNHFKWKGEK